MKHESRTSPFFLEELRGKYLWLAVLVAFLLVGRALYAYHLEVNSDEPQHLHVAWAWVQGLLPYRDVFDNHAPLFSSIYSSVLWILGERSDVVPLMRLTNLPWYLLTLWATYRLGSAIFDKWTGLAAAAITATESTFFLKSIEFRPDTMWAAVWVVALALGMEGTLSVRRSIGVGLLVGIALAVSIKTSVLLASAFVASTVLLALAAYDHRTIDMPFWTRRVAAGLGGFAIVPGLVVVMFSVLGAWPAMRYCLIEHNVAPGLGRWSDSIVSLRQWAALFIAPPLVYVAYLMCRRVDDQQKSFKRAWLLLACCSYLLLRDAFLPLIAGQDLLPWIPMISPFVAAGIGWFARKISLPERTAFLRAAVLVFVVVAQVSLVIARHPFWEDDTAEYSHRLSAILDLAKPDDTVLDAKGDAIFRPRATYWTFENVSRFRFATGLIKDDIDARLASCHVAVVIGDDWPQPLSDFIHANYILLGQDIFIAGKHVAKMEAGARGDVDVAVAQTYRISTDGKPFSGDVDGTPYSGARVLTKGKHSLAPLSSGSVDLEWAGTAPDPCPSSFRQATL
jgi:hypothetical protein